MPRPPKFDPLEYAAEILDSQITPMSAVEWIRKKSKRELWSKQREIAQSVEKNRLTAVKSGHGVGKSFTTSQLATWWIDSHPPEDTMVVSTAPSSVQVSTIMWEEIRKIHRRAGLQGEVQRSDRWIINNDVVGFGRKPQNFDQYAFQGIHRKYVLVIIDEAGGIDEWLWIAALALATGPNCRIIAIGNPEDPSSHFAKICKPNSGWNVIQISVFDSPNFTGEKVDPETASKLTDHVWVDDMREAVGEGSPMWVAKVLGEFPEMDEFSVIPLGWIYRAQERWTEWKNGGEFIPATARHVVGADIARFGGDKSAFAHRYGNVFTKIVTLPKGDTEASADALYDVLNERRNDVGVVDTNGVGAGVYDKVKRRGRKVIPLNVANRTSLKDTTGQIEFYNLRAAAMWKLREALDPARGSTVCLPPDEKLATDLATPHWKVLPGGGGKIVIESKDAIRKRIGRSTDVGDAVVLSWWAGGFGIHMNAEDFSFDWIEDDSEAGDVPDAAIAWSTNADEPISA